MTVWVLEVGHYDARQVHGVYATLDLAKAVPVAEDEVYQWRGEPASREWEEDDEPENASAWYRPADGAVLTECEVQH